MKVYNPTKEKIHIVYKGEPYEVEAKSSIEGVPSDATRYWKKMVHHFIVVSEDRVEKPKKETESKESASPDVTEDSEKPKEEKPKKKASKKK